MEIKTIEVAGFAAALRALRFPFKKDARSEVHTSFEGDTVCGWRRFQSSAFCVIDDKDIELISTLISRGDEHAKPVRGIIAYAEITAPIYFWWDLETYGVGHQRLFSESTMNDEGKKLVGRKLQKALRAISFGRNIRKSDYFSYQTLRHIVIQRYNHRKPEFHEFIEWIKTLPYANELILVGLEDKLAIHDKMYQDCLNEE